MLESKSLENCYDCKLFRNHISEQERPGWSTEIMNNIIFLITYLESISTSLFSDIAFSKKNSIVILFLWFKNFLIMTNSIKILKN